MKFFKMLHKGSVDIEVKERQAASNVDSNEILGQEVDLSPEEVRDVSEVGSPKHDWLNFAPICLLVEL